MDPNERPDSRVHHADALRVARVTTLERAFAIELRPGDAEACTTEEATAQVFAARVDAVPGTANLHASAVAAVRESLCAVVGADRESVVEDSHLDVLRRDVRPSIVWEGLARELRCRLPRLRYTWRAAALTAAALATQGVIVVVADPMPRVALFVVVIGLAGIVAPIWTAVIVIQRDRFPGSMGRVGALADWLVATHPQRMRGGTEWTTGQVAEVVAATFRLDLAGVRLGAVASSILTPLLAFASAALAFLILFRVLVAVS